MSDTETKIDNGSLTPSEYEQIVSVLKEYVRITPKVDEPNFVKDVRAARLKNLRSIIKKMEARMKEFPPQTI